MYYPDLTPYEYTRGCAGSGLLNVGWLEQGHDFPTGECPEGFVERLLALCQDPIELYRGFHECDLDGCTGGALKYVGPGGDEEWLGNGEIQVEGADGTGYRAPSLVYHYVVEHRYLPPPGFIAAVLSTSGHGPSPDHSVHRTASARFLVRAVSWFRRG